MEGGSGESEPSGSISTRDLEAALEAASVGVWTWDAMNNRIRWTPALARVWGINEADAPTTFQAYLELIHPEDRKHVRDVIDTSLDSPEVDFRIVHRIITSSGDIRWIDGRGRVRLNEHGQPIGMMGTGFDITALKRAEAELRRSEECYRLYMSLASDYVYRGSVSGTRPGEGVPEIVVGSFEQTCGYTVEEVEALGGWLQLIVPEDQEALRPALLDVMNGKPVVMEYRIRTKSGEVRWLRDRLRPVLDDDGRMTGAMGGVQDITDRKVLEEQLAQSQRMESLARLAGVVAHDFNNLLTVMYGAEEMLCAPDMTEEDSDEAHDMLRRALGRASELTSSLLSFGRRQVAAIERVDLCGMLRSVEHMLRKAVGERVQLVLSTADGKLMVDVDPGQLELAILNLVLNARGAMSEGGRVELRCNVVEQNVQLPAECGPGRWYSIEVVDEGEGIPPENLQRVFEPFFTTRERGVGTGLGLATVQGIVKQAGGAIEVHSTLGKGTTMQIFLPAAVADRAKASNGKAKPTGGARGGTEHILVVEDEPSVRRVLERTLSDLGYAVRGFGACEELIGTPPDEIAAADLLVSDVRLPGKSGVDLALELSERFPNLKVLLTSGYVEDAKQQAVVESGRFAFLAKPFTQSRLAQRVRELLDAE